MSKFLDGCYDTVTGVALISKVLAGRCTMNYCRAALGKGTIPEEQTPRTMPGPAEYVMDAKITAITNPVEGECQVTIQVNSRDVKEGFYCTGIMLYAEDPDEGEVPYTYMVLENEPEWIRPSSAIVGKLATFDIIAAVGAVDHVTATIDPEAMVTAAQVKQMIAEHNEDIKAHAVRYHIVDSQDRDPTLPDYGIDGGVRPVILDVAPPSGHAEIGVIVSGEEYDAENMSTKVDTAANGSIIIKKVEE